MAYLRSLHVETAETNPTNPAVSEATLDKALEAIALCIGEAVKSEAVDRFAVAQRLGIVGQAIMRERNPSIDAYGEDDENGEGPYRVLRRRRPYRGPDDQVELLREALMALQGQTQATQDTQAAKLRTERGRELNELVELRKALEERGEDVSAVTRRIDVLLSVLNPEDALVLPAPAMQTTGTAIEEEKPTCSGTSPVSTEISASPPNPDSAAASS